MPPARSALAQTQRLPRLPAGAPAESRPRNRRSGAPASAAAQHGESLRPCRRGKRAAVPADTGDLGRRAQRVTGVRGMSTRSCCWSCCFHDAALAALLATFAPTILGAAPGGCGRPLEESLRHQRSSGVIRCLHSRNNIGLRVAGFPCRLCTIHTGAGPLGSCNALFHGLQQLPPGNVHGLGSARPRRPRRQKRPVGICTVPCTRSVQKQQQPAFSAWKIGSKTHAAVKALLQS